MNNLSNILNKKRVRVPYFEKENSSSTSSSINKTNNIKDELENNNNKNKINELFQKNPNLRIKDNILNSNDFHGFSELFEVYISIKDKNQYLISPNYTNYDLDIISLKEKQLMLSLKGHNNFITNVRYFSNNINEYLISADIINIVIIWDITNKTIKNYKIKLNYNNWIYSCLLLFDNDLTYIFISCCGKGNTKMYLLNNDIISFLKNINNSKNKNIYYLLDWYNEKNKKNYLIEFCKKKILIMNIYINKIYANLIAENAKDSCYMTGFVYNSYLYANSMNGFINIWDLYEKKLINSIFIYNSIITNIIQWNQKYIIIVDAKNNSMKIVDIEKGLPISNIFSHHEKGILCIKKINHPIYGESLLSSGQDGYIILWTI